MRYMMLVKGNKDYEAGIPPKKELMEAVAKHGAAVVRVPTRTISAPRRTASRMRGKTLAPTL